MSLRLRRIRIRIAFRHLIFAHPLLQTTFFRHEARDIVRQACNAGEEDACIFVGSGSTAAVCKLRDALRLQVRKRRLPSLRSRARTRGRPGFVVVAVAAC